MILSGRPGTDSNHFRALWGFDVGVGDDEKIEGDEKEHKGKKNHEQNM